MSNYTYSLSQYFPNGVDSSLLYDLIVNDTTITEQLLGISVDQTNNIVTITFATPLTALEQTALNNIISAYVPPTVPTGQKLVLSSSLADSGAVQIIASNAVGGIQITSGLGGIIATTTNAFNVTSGAQSGISVTNGNLVLNSTNALTNIDGYSGINIGNNVNNGPINLGTLTSRSINIGNATGSNKVTINSGTGGLVANAIGGPVSLNATNASSNISLATNADGQNLTLALTGSTNSSIQLSSQGTGVGAISLNSIGGIQLYSTNQPVSIISNNNVGGAITIDTNSGGGGIILSSGSFGIGINSNGGALGIGHWSGGTIDFATAAIARDINIGSNTTGVNIYNRFAASFKTQAVPTTLATAVTINLTIANLLTNILYGTPTLSTTLNLPTAATIMTAFPNLVVNDSFDFSIINLASAIFAYTVSASSSIIGNASVAAGTSGSFRLQITTTSTAPNSYIVYRLS